VLAPDTLTAIDGHHADRDADRHPELLTPGSPRPLVVADQGGRLNRYQVTRIVARLARAASLPDPAKVTPHSCRRAFITHARRAGATPEQVQDAADHKDPRTTRRYQAADDRLEHAPTYLTWTPTDPGSAMSSGHRRGDHSKRGGRLEGALRHRHEGAQ
jgi:integrase/recombinase XerD